MSAFSVETGGSDSSGSPGFGAADAIEAKKPKSSSKPVGLDTASGCPRDFLQNRFGYVVISPRAGGLSIGVNLNPDRYCNFDCVYCEVNRTVPPRQTRLDIEAMAEERDLAARRVRYRRSP